MKKTAKKISIIVPVHNASETLHTCVQSILSQNYESFECILVENGSTDYSADLCREYSKRYPCVKFVVSADKGVSNARNLGLSMATGQIIGFVDADDVMEPNALQCVVTEFEKNPQVVAVIGAFFVGRKLEEKVQKAYRGLKAKSISPSAAIALTVGHDAVMGSVWNKYYKAEVLRNIMFDSQLSYCEDMHYNVKVLSSMPQEYKISLIDTPLYCYMMNETSVTRQLGNLYEENGNLKYIVALKKILDECNLDKKSQSIVKRSIACFAIDYCWIGTQNKIQQKQLKQEIRKNYMHFLKNIMHFGFVGNLKRITKSMLLGLRITCCQKGIE